MPTTTTPQATNPETTNQDETPATVSRRTETCGDSAEPPWPDLDPSDFDRAEFPLEVMPDYLRTVVGTIADFARIRPDSVALAVLAAISAAAANSYVVTIGAEVHPVVIWALMMLASGEGKTPMMSRVAEPMRRVQRERRNKAAYEARDNRIDRRVLIRRRSAMEARLAALLPSNPDVAVERSELRRQLGELELEIEQLAEAALPTLIVDDVTPQALVEVLGRGDGSATMVSDEGSNFLNTVSGGACGDHVEAVLQAWSGSPIVVDRVTRACVNVERPALSLILATQPTAIRRHIQSQRLAERGLWERVLFWLPERRRSRPQEPDGDANRLELGMYSSLLTTLLAAPKAAPQRLRFAVDAHESLRNFSIELEARIDDGDLSEPHLAGWGKKVRSNIVRLAGILHLASTTDPSTAISRDSVEGAIKIMRACLTHARHVLGYAIDQTDSRAVLDHLRSSGQAQMSVRDLRRDLPRRIRNSDEDLRAAIEELRERGLVRLQVEQGPLGRPSTSVVLHPALRGQNAGSRGCRRGAERPDVVPVAASSRSAPAADELLEFRHQPPTVAEPTTTAPRPMASLAPHETPVTTATWPALVVEVVAALPEPLRSRITVGELEVVPATTCPACGGSTYADGDVCLGCQPDARGRRRNLGGAYRRLVMTVDGLQTVALVEYPTLGHAGLSAGFATSGRAHPVLTLPAGEFLQLNERAGHCPFSSTVVFTEMLASLLRAELDRAGGNHA